MCSAAGYCQVGNSIVPFDSYAVIDRSALASPNVRAQGVPVVRHDSQCLINCNAAGVGGAPGRLVTEFSSVQSEPPPEGPETPSPELQALLDKEADERSI